MEIKDMLVLLVEPSATQQKIIAGHFRALGVAEVLCAGSGAEALEQMRRMPPDLVVSSMYLPDGTGYEIVRSMRESADLQETAYMLISSETDFAQLDPIRQAGVVAILPKPFHGKHLDCAMQATLDFYNPDNIDLDGEDIEDVRVLVVDDSRMARKHIRRVLENLGLENFTEAENGREAVARMSDGFYDLVVTDYNMPEMDGQELVTYIRSNSDQRDIPVLMVTSEESGSRLSGVKQAGVSAICDKPFEPAVVKSLLQGMLG